VIEHQTAGAFKTAALLLEYRVVDYLADVIVFAQFTNDILAALPPPQP
jgi:hypothetical protein